MELGKYRLLEEVGRGTYGVVYNAVDTTSDQILAIKIFHPYIAQDTTFLYRFQQLSMLLAKLDHPAFVPTRELGESQGTYYVVKDWMPGGSLKNLINSFGPLSADQTSKLISEIAEGLAFAHYAGLVHGDLKPENILFDIDGRAKISDFGISLLMNPENDASQRITGGLIGTPAYMAPELWSGGKPSPLSDIYSLGCILTESITGTVFFGGDSLPSIMLNHYRTLQLPDSFPVGLRQVVYQSLEKDPNRRINSVSAFVRTMQSGLNPYQSARIDPDWRVPPYDTQIEQDISPESDFSTANGRKKNKSFLLPLMIGATILLAAIVAVVINRKPANPVIPVAGDRTTPTVSETIVSDNEFVTSYPPPSRPDQETEMPAVTPTSTTRPTMTPEIEDQSTQVRQKDLMEIEFIPAGKFVMGSTDGEPDEWVVRTVNLAEFWIDRYEVSNAQYAACVNLGYCSNPGNSDSKTRFSYFGNPAYSDYPVIYVDWYQALEYCQWVGGSLPTEAQWEKAAGGPDRKTYPWGQSPPNENIANFAENYGDTMPVASFEHNASDYGTINMSGNVSEWTMDWFADYNPNELNNPTGPSNGTYKIHRGGNWESNGIYLRSANRAYDKPTSFYYNLGFRCVDGN